MTRSTLVAFALLATAAALPAQERVAMRRMADTVAIRRGPDRTENVLYYFAASAELEAGDELEQGSSGHSQVYLSGGGLIELHNQAHMILLRLDPEADVVRFPWLTVGSMQSGERPLVCELPGGITTAMHQTLMEVRAEDGRIKIRNRGSQPIRVQGIISIEPGGQEAGTLELQQGQEAFLPLIRYSPDPPGKLRQLWGDLALRHNGGFALQPSGESLEVSAADDPEAPRDDVLTVGGVRTRLDGPVVSISNHRRPVPEPIDIYSILQRVSGSDEELTPERVQELLRLYPIEELRAIGIGLSEEREQRDSGEVPGAEPVDDQP
jgi:hypothetical protein